jgi:hypothetical protein
MTVVRFPHKHPTLTDQRVADLLARARHGRLPIAKDILYEFIHLLTAANVMGLPWRVANRYETAQRVQKLNTLLEQYDRHLRKTRARVRSDASDNLGARRCDGCRRRWHKGDGEQVTSGPMLKNEIWARICADRPRDILCDLCVRTRVQQVYQRQLRIDDLKPCPINVMSGYYQELLGEPPRVLADWARAITETVAEAPQPTH